MELLANRLCWRCPKRQSSNYPHVVTGRRVSRKCHIQTVAINTLINLHTKKASLILPVSFSFAFMPHAKYAKFAHGIMHEQWSDFAPLPQKNKSPFRNPQLSRKQWKPQSRVEMYTSILPRRNKKDTHFSAPFGGSRLAKSVCLFAR